jgi:uncharacterized protein YqeY
MDLQAKLREAMKARDELAKGLLRVVLGEVSTRRARTGQEPTEAEVQGIIRKVMAGNDETRRELERHGQTGHEAYGRLARENAYLQTLLPRALDREAIRQELQPIVADLRGAKNDGQATGLAVKHLKGKGLAVPGEDVAAAVRDIRAG